MLTVRTNNGTTTQLYSHTPLRLRLIPLSQATELKADVIRRVFSFLPDKSEDWLAADSCCVAWREAALPLWRGQRDQVAASIIAKRLAQTKWRELHGFLNVEIIKSLRGPATEQYIQDLKEAIHPWVLPPVLIASLRIHDGEINRGTRFGMYLGSRLLSASEITEICLQWRRQANSIQQHLDETSQSSQPAINTTSSGILRLPMFAEAGARQVAMELHMGRNQRQEQAQSLEHQNGRIVLISNVTPFAPYLRVLAGSWDGFLTLI